jgi:phosphatidylethanolamine/phosphatidyl-N-methylethanolamine N-methyltransferase
MTVNHSNGRRVPIDLESVRTVYRRYAPTYDFVFGPIFQRGRDAVAQRVNRSPFVRILEVGVGTGLSLPLYAADKQITGVDVSPEMLAHARQRVVDQDLKNVVQLTDMDAESLDFEDNTFDAVVASYVMSVVPDPQRCLAEMERVCAPNGTIFICNHFVNGHGGSVSKRMQPLSRWLGWRPAFELDELLETTTLRTISIDSMQPFGLFSMLTLQKDQNEDR